MKKVFGAALFAAALSSAVYAQQAPAAPAAGGVAVANPHYVAIPMEIGIVNTARTIAVSSTLPSAPWVPATP